MDAKITKKRLGHLLSYDWVKMLIAVVAAIFVWVMVFSMTATRITSTQRFVVSNYLGVNYGQGIKLYSDRYSYEILEGEAANNLRGGDEMFNDLFMAEMEIGESDLLMVADVPMSREAKKDEQGNELKDGDGNVIYEYGDSYLKSAVARAFGSLTRLDDGTNGEKGYFTQMKEYLARFYKLDSENVKTFGGVSLTVASFQKDSFNEAAVEAEFRARVQKNKDKRFKKEEQILQGIKAEKERIRSYLTAYETFFTYLENGYVTFTETSAKISENLTVSGVYSINLCPKTETMGGLKEHFYYVDFEGTTTAKNMNVCFFGFEELDKDFQYENLLYLNALIADVCSEL